VAGSLARRGRQPCQQARRQLTLRISVAFGKQRGNAVLNRRAHAFA
jgi:hypothetical protein